MKKAGACEEKSREDNQNGINTEMDEEKDEEERSQQLKWTRLAADGFRGGDADEHPLMKLEKFHVQLFYDPPI